MLDLARSDVFLDICTQRDYLAEGGTRPSVNGPQLLPNLKRLMAFERWAGVPTISCMDAHHSGEVRGTLRPDCVIGTPGQRKIGFSIMPRHVLIDSDNYLSIPLDILVHFQQAIFTKAHRDPFTNPKLDRLLTEMPAGRFVVFGVSLEVSIRLLVLGLLLRRRKVVLVEDACGFWSGNEAKMTVRQLIAKGCEIVSTEGLIRSAFGARKLNGQSRSARSRSVA
ncbi:MAG: cysteine hydrolase family protein [Planctomycetes bacterium]|nr:cysteine hydrolase family protein [Planctomycetota bacterium]